MEQAVTILVVDDDPDITNLLEVYLADEGYNVLIAHTAAEMWRLMEISPANLVLLDVGLPDGDGFNLTQILRAHTQAAIIIISSKNENIDQVVGLEVGADDYVTKPFEPRNLLARIRSVLRRYHPENSPGNFPGNFSGNAPEYPRDSSRGRSANPPHARAQSPPTASPELKFGTWRFDPTTYRLVSQSGHETVLSANESALLGHLLRNAGRVMSRDDLMNATAGRDWEYMDRSIDILIARLRKKIEPNPGRPTTIKTVRGAGYVLSRDTL